MLRRSSGLIAALSLGLAMPAGAQQVTPSDSLLRAAIQGIRMPIGATTCGLSGAGGELLAELAGQAQFTIIGEAHGVSDVPRFSGALFCRLVASGYKHLAIEVSPPTAVELNRRAAAANPVAEIQRFGEERFPGAPFYMLREEAELLSKAVGARRGAPGVLWGIDYDVNPEGQLFHRLAALATPASRPSTNRLKVVAESMYTAALAAKNPSRVFAFAGADSLVAAVRRDLRPAKGSEADRLLAVLEQTLRINRLWNDGQGYESNRARSENLRENFLVHYRAASRSGPAPRAMIKLGASHSYRGRSLVNTFDVGSLVPELAAELGRTSVGIMLVGGNGSQDALFDINTFSYAPVPGAYNNVAWLRPFYALADSSAWTLFDLRRLRPPLTQGRLGTVAAGAQQAIFGFDFLVVLGGSKPSEPLPLKRPAWGAVPAGR
ncbi:MAG: hypothetical protein HOP28_07245 [Gemmatimonadales bacterium]|nr:hypothetical protein [Gemmatimonadales bacterium]